jgi:hypothetical protein
MIRHAIRSDLIPALLLLGLARSGGAGEALPPDLAFVPDGAVGFLHVRLVDVWESPGFKFWRETVLQAGEPALKAFNSRFIPSPSSLDRLTVAVSLPGANEREPQVFAILRTSQPIDREAFFKYTFPGSREEAVNGKKLHVDQHHKMGVAFLDDRTLVFGLAQAVRVGLEKAPAGHGPLSDALALANSGKAVVAGVNVAALAPMIQDKIPPQLQPLARAKLATLTIELAKKERVTTRLIYNSPEDARAAEEAAQSGLQMVRSKLAEAESQLRKKVMDHGQPGRLDELPEAAAALVGLGGLKRLDQSLAHPPLTRAGSTLEAAFTLPRAGPEALAIAAIGAWLMLPAVQKVREAAERTQDMNNLKQMALAMHNYADQTRTFPPAAICDSSGKPLLSWRVAILPYIDQDHLYRQFKLDEPWDSPHNRRLIAQMPQVYASPLAPPGKPGQTHYRVFVGNGAAFELNRGIRPTEFTDGMSNTILMVETADTVPWTKPEDIPYGPNQPLPRLLSAGGQVFLAAFADGSVHTLSMHLAQEKLRALITRAGGEPVPPGGW